MERWEQGFDSWTPRADDVRGGGDADGIDAEREELQRLARELADQRRATEVSSDGELDELKRSLRERAEAVAARERELAELQRRLDRTAKKRGRAAAAAIAAAEAEALAARERSSFERARELERLAVDLDARAALLVERERELEALRAGAPAGGAVDGDLAARWRELEVARVSLETERETLRARERTLRRQEDAHAQPLPPEALTPPSFADGLASFTRGRSRT